MQKDFFQELFGIQKPEKLTIFIPVRVADRESEYQEEREEYLSGVQSVIQNLSRKAKE